jgi:hypothetical protein
MKKERYFYVTYKTSIVKNMGSYTFLSKNGMFNRDKFRKIILEDYPMAHDVMITSIYEFKNKKDYEDFIE